METRGWADVEPSSHFVGLAPGGPITEFRLFRNIFVKEINPEYSLEGLMLKLKLQYFGH